MISNETNTTNNLDHILGGLNITMAGVRLTKYGHVS